MESGKRTAEVVDEPMLELEGVYKRYGQVYALDNVTFDVRPGEVHALLGENGAGKSTLVGVAAGSVVPDAGRIMVGGAEIGAVTPSTMSNAGVCVVRQRPDLVDDLPIAENMYLALGDRPVFDRRRYLEYCSRILDPWGMEIDPAQLVGETSMPQRFVVEIARALASDPKVLFLDEPTEHLGRADVELLFAELRRLKQAGTAIVYISHRLSEVRQIADRVTVLRDGSCLDTFPAAEKTEDEIVTIMVGRQVDTVMPPKASEGQLEIASAILEVDGLGGKDFHDITFSVRQGEIVVLAGIADSGQSDLLRAVAGHVPSRGSVRVQGREISVRTVRAGRRGGLVYIPADRQSEGLVMQLSVAENIILGTLEKVSRTGIVLRKRLTALADESVRRFDVKTPSIHTPVNALSGGNQQKVVFAKTMLATPRVLLAEEPTQGVDVRTRAELYRVIRDFTSAGGAVVMVTTDTLEAAGLGDRILVMERGSIAAELTGSDVTERGVTAATVLADTTSQSTTRRRRGKLVRLLGASDYAPPIVLAGIAILLALVTATFDPAFLGERSVSNMLQLIAPLLLVAIGQSLVLLLGAIDLSIGPLSALVLVVGSFFFVEGGSPGQYVTGALAIVGVAVIVGLVNGSLTRVLQMNPVIATLVTFIALQGVGTLLRPTPDGVIAPGLTDALGAELGIVPVALVIALLIMAVLELWLRRTRGGIQFRAVGSRDDVARRLGVPATPRFYLAYLVSASLGLATGLLLMAQIGIGDPAVGTNYSLLSVAAAVLGGVSLFGGRGSLVGALVGSILLVMITTAATFMQLGPEWQIALQGLVILIGVGAYSIVRRHSGGAPA